MGVIFGCKRLYPGGLDTKVLVYLDTKNARNWLITLGIGMEILMAFWWGPV